MCVCVQYDSIDLCILLEKNLKHCFLSSDSILCVASKSFFLVEAPGTLVGAPRRDIRRPRLAWLGQSGAPRRKKNMENLWKTMVNHGQEWDLMMTKRDLIGSINGGPGIPANGWFRMDDLGVPSILGNLQMMINSDK